MRPVQRGAEFRKHREISVSSMSQSSYCGYDGKRARCAVSAIKI